MTVARSKIVDIDVTPFYHCISECIRGSHLCGEGYEHRKAWIENRLQALTGIFAVSVTSYSVMGNHVHVVLRLEGTKAVGQWSDREVAERWGKLYPPRGKGRKPQPVTEEWIQQKISDQKWVQETRERLANIGWFMKCLKEPLARMANKEDNCRGAFWASRYKSIAILDEEALLATCAYVDLNPFAAGIVELPEKSPYTSIKARMAKIDNDQQQPQLQAALSATSSGTALTAEVATQFENGHWLCPFSMASQSANGFGGMLEGFSLPNYLNLLDETSRLVRDGKHSLSRQAATILERLGTTANVWTSTIKKMHSRDRLLGVAFAFSRERLKSAATKRGCHHLANLNGCQA